MVVFVFGPRGPGWGPAGLGPQARPGPGPGARPLGLLGWDGGLITVSRVKDVISAFQGAYK